jgi:2-polyprenyl-3-methyl-5-hydroxy-6-metoxy-1,4-benzoquinol methylase/chromosome segregation ATPase
MQPRPLKRRKSYPKHPELTIAPPDPNTSIAHMREMIGERKKVLDLGCASGYLASLLVKRECDIVGIDCNAGAVEEARRFCASAFVADLDEIVLPELLAGMQFDVIVFGDVLQHLHEPARTLDEARALLADDGYVVASIPNVSHGAIRLALLSGSFDYQELGILDDAHLRFFTGKTIDELFLTTGFTIEKVERVTLPLFAKSDLVPALDPRDFDPTALAEVRADSESETLQFVIKAFPLPSDLRLRAVSKRFLTVNTELAGTKQQIAHRESELEAQREALNSRAAVIDDLRAKADRLESELDETREQRRELERSYRLLEIDSLTKLNGAMQQTLAAQTELNRSVEVIAELRSQLDEAEHTQPQLSTETAEPYSAALHEDFEHERRVLRQRLDGEQQRAATIAAERGSLGRELEALQHEFGEVAAERNEAQRWLAKERQRAMVLELRLADAEEYKDELTAGVNKLRLLVDSLEPQVGDLHVEVAALRRRNVELEASLELQLAEGAQLADELAVERNALEAERRRGGAWQSEAEARRSIVASLESKLSIALDNLERSEVALSEVEREYCDRVARTESDCADLLAEATEAIIAVNSELEVESAAVDAHLREHTAKASELEAQLDAIRKAASADKLIMREYADEFRHRAESAEKELHGAIRQRDDLYLRVVDADRTIGEVSERNVRLDEDIRYLEGRLRDEYAHNARADSELKRAQTELAALTAHSEAAIADLSARASSLENDLCREQAVLQHLRESASSDRARADIAAAELASLAVRHEILQASLAESDNRLVAQTEELLASTSDERDRLLTLIDTVQSSHFWRLKHWLARLRARIFGVAAVRG